MRNRHSLKSIYTCVLLALASPAVSANPFDPTVVSGQASFASTGNTLTVTNTPGAIINWQRFSIGANEITRFDQQSAASAVLNRVISNNPSSIFGALQSNGRVFLINPNGIVFGAGAVVDVAGLVASTLNLSDADFLAGRNSFTQVPGAASISNAGDISAQDGGQIFLIAPNVENTGVITAANGEILLAAGHSVDLVDTSDPDLRVNITAPAGDATNVGQLIASSGSLGLFGTVVRNSGTVSADSATLQGGKIVFKASVRAEIGGTVSANGASGGSVDISVAHSLDANAPGVVIHTGSVQAKGAAGAGGTVSISADSILSSAAINADGATAGGKISVQAANRALSTASAKYTANSTQGQGGDILVSANVSNYTSGSYSATGMTGGNLTLAGNEIKLAGAQLDASGTNGGGTIRVGGSMHGAAGFATQGIALTNATNVLTNSAAALKADALQTGNGGQVVLWSDQAMRFTGNISARGGALSGNGGMAEVSGLTSLGYGGLTNLSATNGLNGTLLLDPRNITIVAGGGASPFKEILDTTPYAGEGFGGFQNLALSNGNIVIASPLDDQNGANSGAVYLYDPAGTLLSALLGSAAGDKVGGVTYNEYSVPVDRGGLAELGNGNVVVASNNWSGTLGAVTWMDGLTGLLSDGFSVGGTVSASNSLVGSLAGDKIGTFSYSSFETSGIHVIGNVVIQSSNWGGAGVAANARGAVTWMSGTTGRLSNNLNGGAVSSGNSLVGAVAGDKVGSNTFGIYDQSGLLVLSNGNLLVESNNWGGTFGAVTWMDGATGLLSDGFSTGGFISTANSLVGSMAGDRLGSDVRQLYINNNAVVFTPNWSNGGATANAGAVTWISGTTGKLSDLSNGGVISAANSLVGNVAGDQVGSGGFTILTDYTTFWNYAVRSNLWGGTLGAVTWMNGSTGLLSDASTGGVVAPSNSVVGSIAGDKVGTLTLSPYGFTADQTGLLVVGNGNLVVASNNWDNGAATDAGAVTWMNGATGRLSNNANGGAITVSNSLVGSTSGDRLGTAVPSYGSIGLYEFSGLTVLANGNLVVSSNYWDNGTAIDAGAVTWMSGTTGRLTDGVSTGGDVSAANSVVGSTANDKVGGGLYNYYNIYSNGRPVTPANGNLVFSSPFWDNGAVANVGAVTWMNGATGKLSDGSNGGAISSANSLIGSTASDAVGTTPRSGFPSDYYFSPQVIANGNLIFTSETWDNGAATDAGALTWMNGASGLLSDGVSTGGAVSVSNSLVGSTANDFNSSSFHQLLNGNLLIQNMTWDNGANVDAGAMTWMNATTGVLSDGTWGGAVTLANSLVSATGGSNLGSGGVTELGNGNVVISSPSWANGAVAGAGAVTWMNSLNGRLSDASTGGAVSATNSLIGSTANDGVSSNGVTVVTDNSTYWNYAVQSSGWDNIVATAVDAGAITWVNGTTGKTSDTLGTISSANSVVGSTAGDAVGATSVLVLGNGNAVFASSSWNGGMGAVTWMKGLDGTLADATNGGAVSAANSLVGSNQTLSGPPYTQGDQIGSGGLTLISDYSTYWNYAVRSPNWTSGAATGAGAVTLGNGATGTVGVVSAGNSLVGDATGDAIGSGGIRLLGNGHFVVSSPDWRSGGTMYAGLGAVTWVNGQTGALSDGSIGGVVGSTNSLVGLISGDKVGSLDPFASTSGSLIGINVFGNSNLLIRSQAWGGGVSALSWMSGATGRLAGGATGGAVSATNSLLGSTLNDNLGSGEVGVTELLVNGNWVITSANWGNASDWGAATWMNSTNGQLADGSYGGVVSATNSLVGTATTPGWIDFFCDCGFNGVAGGVAALSDGNYVAYWQDFTPDVGAVTWGNGSVGSVGTLSASNSLFEFVNTVQEMPLQPGKVLIGSKTANGGEGGVYVLGDASLMANSSQSFANSPGVDAVVGAGWIASTLSGGTNIVLQANNDIIQVLGAVINATGAGNLTLQAGRSVILNDDITIGGALSITANDTGAILVNRTPGPGVLDTSGAILKAGQVILNNYAGDVSIGTIIGGTGAVTVAASGGNFINNSGSATPIATTGKISVYSTDPAADTLNGMGSSFHRYNCTYLLGCLTAGTVIPATGTGFFYSNAPTLTITANAATKTYGTLDASALTYTATGFVVAAGDTAANVLTGSLSHIGTEDVGTAYPITQGTLANQMGYGITFTGNSLDITPAALTVAANAASKILNTTDPLLTYVVSGLQFADTAANTLTGSLSRIAGETVGSYLINQGSLALSLTGPGGNYTMSYVPANFTILVPTVIDEIVNTSLLFGPDTGSARSTSSKDEEDKAKEEILADVDIKPVDGAVAQPLPVCN